ncbi:stage V sporulation protein AD [Viridibacillus sp. FSL R5-0477]|nr:MULTISPECIES: SpoVAD [Viridibacillus]OMC81757.1 stage V sporulation protein AD [Viridibacillus sp. FSL H8-0123]OMC89080.1 stage V sporulation protein AD [Viridibacillus sp. FSL H7-0596]OMC89811.1 stage V sporulation protein AD [Viridibacillus arenosi]
MVMDKGVIYFPSKPSILAAGVVVGPLEKRSVFARNFDLVLDDERADQKTNEQGHQHLIEEAAQIALQKKKLTKDAVDFFIGGDLVNQMTPTNFAAATIGSPFIGMYSACATSTSAVIIASLLTELGGSHYAIAGAASQHNAIERQFRYPVDYGGQKPATAQWTVTAAGYVLIGKHQEGEPCIEAATFGKVADFQQSDPFHMGAAMAPAAFSTIKQHLKGRGQTVQDYDVIMTGDLGKVGLPILKEMLRQAGFTTKQLETVRDGGAEYYGDNPLFLAGASGAGCSASVFFSEILAELKSGRMKRVLLVATGALLSPLSVQQNQSIPTVAHAIEVTMK